MAYGQTGTGKTYTLGRLGEEDTADRGIMVRAMEDILAEISPETDSVSVSYSQVVSISMIWYITLYCCARLRHIVLFPLSHFASHFWELYLLKGTSN